MSDRIPLSCLTQKSIQSGSMREAQTRLLDTFTHPTVRVKGEREKTIRPRLPSIGTPSVLG